MKLRRGLRYDKTDTVAPHWGAWIEIGTTPRFAQSMRSHPTGVRGLKCARLTVNGQPFAESHPTGVRGLKFHSEPVHVVPVKSHPTGVRGLKFDTMAISAPAASRTPLGCVD